MLSTLNQLTNHPARKSLTGSIIGDPLQFLVDCHEQIEERLRTLERLIPNLRSDSEERRQVAREALDDALCFLTTMGKLHTEDEEQSLFPRLLINSDDDAEALAELAATLEAQHREKELVLGKLVAYVRNLPPAPRVLPAEQVNRVEALVLHLGSLYRPHIMLENQRLIPLSADHLKEHDLEEMRHEMCSRRES